jgi:hypothetical protein
MSTNTRSPATGYWIGTMLPVIMIIPRRPCRRKFARKPTEHIQRMTHHIDAFAVAEFAPINREARRHLSKIQHRPVGFSSMRNGTVK